MSVGINGSIGKPMIREGQGLDIFVRRSLRDVFKKVPTLSVEVKVQVYFSIFDVLQYLLLVSRTWTLNKAFFLFWSLILHIARLGMTILINVIVLKGSPCYEIITIFIFYIYHCLLGKLETGSHLTVSLIFVYHP